MPFGAADFSTLPIGALGSLLSSHSLCVESEDAFLGCFVGFGTVYSAVLGPVQPRFVSKADTVIVIDQSECMEE
jgi:hypothetical protein